MPDRTNRIECPNCGTFIDVNQVFVDQLRKESDEALAEQRQQIQQKRETLEAREAELEVQVEEQVKTRVKEERSMLKKKLSKDLKSDFEDQIAEMQIELKERSEQVKKLGKLEAQNARLGREKGELEVKYKAEAEQQVNEALKVAREDIRKNETERVELALRERDKTIGDLKSKLQDAQRRAEQGSTQLQGEVQELAIEEWLQAEFPLDTITEIKKGARGGDCLQTVNTRKHTRCGVIYYESKRTKQFQPAWIAKLKDDMRAKGADVAVLVTEAMPTNMERMGMVDGVYVCSYSEFKGLSHVLREMIIRLDMALATSKNKGDKMEMLYSFLTSNEFKLQIEVIVEGFTSMNEDLESEKRSMRRIWKKREKQIQRVVQSTSEMYGSIQGIAGAALPTVEILQLPTGEEDLKADMIDSPELL